MFLYRKLFWATVRCTNEDADILRDQAGGRAHAAETALQRVDGVNYSIGWIHALIADDPEAAKLALRAIATYAHYYSQRPLSRLKNEVGEQAMQIYTVSKQLTNVLSEPLYKGAK